MKVLLGCLATLAIGSLPGLTNAGGYMDESAAVVLGNHGEAAKLNLDRAHNKSMGNQIDAHIDHHAAVLSGAEITIRDQSGARNETNASNQTQSAEVSDVSKQFHDSHVVELVSESQEPESHDSATPASTAPHVPAQTEEAVSETPLADPRDDQLELYALFIEYLVTRIETQENTDRSFLVTFAMKTDETVAKMKSSLKKAERVLDEVVVQKITRARFCGLRVTKLFGSGSVLLAITAILLYILEIV